MCHLADGTVRCSQEAQGGQRPRKAARPQWDHRLIHDAQRSSCHFKSGVRGSEQSSRRNHLCVGRRGWTWVGVFAASPEKSLAAP